jgi:hypothetical protein
MRQGNVSVVLKDGSEFIGAAGGLYAWGLQGAVRFETATHTIRISYAEIEQIIFPAETAQSA